MAVCENKDVDVDMCENIEADNEMVSRHNQW